MLEIVEEERACRTVFRVLHSEDGEWLATLESRADAELFVRAKHHEAIARIVDNAFCKPNNFPPPSLELQGLEWWLPPEPDHILDKEG